MYKLLSRVQEIVVFPEGRKPKEGEKLSERERAERSLFWFGDFRECPTISEQAKEEAVEAVVFWSNLFLVLLCACKR